MIFKGFIHLVLGLRVRNKSVDKQKFIGPGLEFGCAIFRKGGPGVNRAQGFQKRWEGFVRPLGLGVWGTAQGVSWGAASKGGNNGGGNPLVYKPGGGGGNNPSHTTMGWGGNTPREKRAGGRL